MQASYLLLLANAAFANGFRLTAGTMTQQPARAISPVRMQTLIPEAPTIEKAPMEALPSTWDVPDTFTFPVRKAEQPPFYRASDGLDPSRLGSTLSI